MKQTLIPKEWRLVKLGEISDSYAGGTPSRSKKGFYGGNILWVKSGEVSNRDIIDTEEKITESGLENSSARKVPANTVLVAMYGATAGKVGILRKEATTNQAVLAIADNKNMFDTEFLYYLLSSKTNKLVNTTQGTGQPNLSKTLIDSLEIIVPSNLQEQTAIAKILSTTDEALEALERERLATERLRRGIMVKLLENRKWRLANIQDIFYIETGTTPPTKDKTYWLNGTIDWITPADMNDLGDKLDLPESRRKITEKALKEVNLTLMPIDSIVISTRAPVGYIGLAKKELTFNQGCKGLIPRDKSKTNTFFYAYYLASLKDYLNNISGGSTFKELSKDSLCKLELPIPPLEEQRHIAEILSTIDKKLELEKARKEKIERVKKGLMDELLTGKKRVNVERVLEGAK